MEVTYNTTMEDYLAFNMHVFSRSRSMKLQFGIMWVLGPIFFWLFATFIFLGHDLNITIFFFMAGVAWALFYPIYYRARMRNFVRRFVEEQGARGIFGRTTLILGEDTFTENTSSVQTVVRWQDMVGIEVVGDCTYFYLTSISGAILPRHGFDRAEDYEAAKNFALAKFGKPGKPL